MSNCPEVVQEGWLIKSPPDKRIFRARWRRRWFVLRQSGELPGQYYLCYYTDRNCRKLKGQIDLDECEQVDTGLQFENSKTKYQHMFDVRTPKRIYYLAADTEEEMNKWVHNVCTVCGLKAFTPEDEAYSYGASAEEEPSTPTTVITEHDTESPPVSPSSTTSAYIPISECITGPPMPGSSGLTLPTASWRSTSLLQRQQQIIQPVKRSVLVTNNNVSTSSCGPSGFSSVDLMSGDLRTTHADWDSHKVMGDGTVFRYDFQQDGCATLGSVMAVSGIPDEEPTSPRSESSSVTSATQYSNLPSPHILPSGGIPTPPAVDRGLKPRRKMSDSAVSNEPSPSPLSQHSAGPPSVDRKLKPKKYPEEHGFLTLSAPPGKRQENGTRSLRKTRTGPSPTPPQPSGSISSSSTLSGYRSRVDHCSSSDDDHRHSPDDDSFYLGSCDHRFISKGKEIKYLDLDLDLESKDSATPSTSLASVLSGLSVHPAPKSPEKGPPTATVYKTVDFIKTEAFNRTRIEVEAEKKKKENG